ncbi:MAG: hypothetical protein DRI69_03715 [Bacteroidetes bacterium]|nr:MAG: hypothetical protein DRI69_03715 [Bacteroidota bacterium]
MSKLAHRIYILTFVFIVLATLCALIFWGVPYYSTSIEERFYHPDHDLFKPSGLLGHGLGIIGTLIIIFGVASYMMRKRMKSLQKVGILKHWLEFHIFLCTLGPVLVLFHTAFKFGGIVSVSFWSMVGVVISGVIGRFIYIQIPRTIEGRELSLNEVRQMKTDLGTTIGSSSGLDQKSMQLILKTTQSGSQRVEGSLMRRIIAQSLQDWKTKRTIRSIIKPQVNSRTESKKIMRLVKNELSLNNRIDRLLVMQSLFKHWHVAHLPFAIVMLIIMIIHVAITLAFGYKWIF